MSKSTVNGLRIPLIIFIHLSLAFFLTDVNGDAWCFKCDELANCKVPVHFLKYVHEEDEGKVVRKKSGDSSNPTMDRCLSPGHKISGSVLNTICSGSVDGACHAIGAKSKNPKAALVHCKLCDKHCHCREERDGNEGGGKKDKKDKKHKRDKGNALKENSITVTICLVTFYILI
ncbi:uncharacterized protein LOC108658498 [Drosophila navojoa]|uniref:uncharacterized protein LOC108658498 n=1 Tax=Drosophila navojoa TaxID=7232 RepID=UPI000846BE10|nr:uncharacterized protein LOC108658498 [Drosophila navojoa]